MDEQLHDRVAELLSAYIDGEVTTDERLLVERHLEDCNRCAQELETLRQTISWLRALPPVAAPRPFTLRLEDVGLAPIEPPRPRPWWQAVAASAWIGVAAALVCVLLVGGGLLLNRVTPVQIAHQPKPAITAAADSVIAEKAAVPAPLEATGSAGESEVTMAEAEAPAAAEAELTASNWDEVALTEDDEEAEFAAAAVPAEATSGGAAASDTAQTGQEGDLAAGEGGDSQAVDLAPATVTPVVVPTPTPQLASVAEETLEAEDRALAEGAVAKEMPAVAPAPAEVLALEVSNLRLHIEPGMIAITGTLPLKKGVRLSASLWRDGQPMVWAAAESGKAVVGDKGLFSLQLSAAPDTPDFDLFAAEPAAYEVRLAPEETEVSMEAIIPFDTLVPPSP